MRSITDIHTALCPIVWLAPGEPYLPVDLTTAIAAFKAAPSPLPDLLSRVFPCIPAPAVRPPVEPQLSTEAGRQRVLSQVPLYYILDPSEPAITYVHMYARDGGLHGRGGHAVDIEFVRFVFDPESRHIRRAYYAQHGRDAGAWIPGARVPRASTAQGARPVIFSARNTHATYPGPGTWARVFCFANDWTGRGTRWDPLASSDMQPVALDPVAFAAAFRPGFMQWAAPSVDLAGSPRRLRWLYRLMYPASARVLAMFRAARVTAA